MHKDFDGEMHFAWRPPNDGIERLELGERQASEECMRIDRKVVMVGDDMKVQRRH